MAKSIHGPMIGEDEFDGAVYEQRRDMLARRIQGKFRAHARDGRVLYGEDNWLCLTDAEGFFILSDDEVEANWERVTPLAKVDIAG